MAKTDADAAPLQIAQYNEGIDKRTPDGYFWMKLAEIPVGVFNPMAAPESRALVCQRCGVFVAFTREHNEWHDSP